MELALLLTVRFEIFPRKQFLGGDITLARRKRINSDANITLTLAGTTQPAGQPPI